MGSSGRNDPVVCVTDYRQNFSRIPHRCFHPLAPQQNVHMVHFGIHSLLFPAHIAPHHILIMIICQPIRVSLYNQPTDSVICTSTAAICILAPLPLVEKGFHSNHIIPIHLCTRNYSSLAIVLNMHDKFIQRCS